jgi:hypothetical protein
MHFCVVVLRRPEAFDDNPDESFSTREESLHIARTVPLLLLP